MRNKQKNKGFVFDTSSLLPPGVLPTEAILTPFMPRLEAEAEARRKATLGRQRWARRQRDARRRAAREAAAQA